MKTIQKNLNNFNNLRFLCSVYKEEGLRGYSPLIYKGDNYIYTTNGYSLFVVKDPEQKIFAEEEHILQIKQDTKKEINLVLPEREYRMPDAQSIINNETEVILCSKSNAKENYLHELIQKIYAALVAVHRTVNIYYLLNVLKHSLNWQEICIAKDHSLIAFKKDDLAAFIALIALH